MNFAFLDAGADVGAASNISLLLIMGVMGLVIYFLMYRPQKKKEKQQQELRNSIEIGDEVTTIGGIVGRVVSIKEDTFVIETAGDRSRMRFRRWAIQEVSDKVSLGGEEPATTPEAPAAKKTWAERRAEKKAEKES